MAELFLIREIDNAFNRKNCEVKASKGRSLANGSKESPLDRRRHRFASCPQYQAWGASADFHQVRYGLYRVVFCRFAPQPAQTFLYHVVSIAENKIGKLSNFRNKNFARVARIKATQAARRRQRFGDFAQPKTLVARDGFAATMGEIR